MEFICMPSDPGCNMVRSEPHCAIWFIFSYSYMFKKLLIANFCTTVFVMDFDIISLWWFSLM